MNRTNLPVLINVKILLYLRLKLYADINVTQQTNNALLAIDDSVRTQRTSDCNYFEVMEQILLTSWLIFDCFTRMCLYYYQSNT